LVDFYFHKKALHNLNFLKYSGGPSHCQAEISENSKKTRNKFLEYYSRKRLRKSCEKSEETPGSVDFYEK